MSYQVDIHKIKMAHIAITKTNKGWESANQETLDILNKLSLGDVLYGSDE